MSFIFLSQVLTDLEICHIAFLYISLVISGVAHLGVATNLMGVATNLQGIGAHLFWHSPPYLTQPQTIILGRASLL